MTLQREPSELEDRLARGVIHMANATFMTTAQWERDRDITLALEVLGWSVRQAKTMPDLDLPDDLARLVRPGG